MQLDRLILGDERRELELDSELVILNRYGPGIGPALKNRNGKLPAYDEAGVLSVASDEVRLG